MSFSINVAVVTTTNSVVCKVSTKLVKSVNKINWMLWHSSFDTIYLGSQS